MRTFTKIRTHWKHVWIFKIFFKKIKAGAGGGGGGVRWRKHLEILHVYSYYKLKHKHKSQRHTDMCSSRVGGGLQLLRINQCRVFVFIKANLTHLLYLKPTDKEKEFHFPYGSLWNPPPKFYAWNSQNIYT